MRAPVDHPFATINQTLFIQADKNLSDRRRQMIIMVNRSRDQSQDDPSRLSCSVMRLPYCFSIPKPVQKGFPPDILFV